MNDFNVVIPDIGDAQDVEVIEICVEVEQTISADDALLVIESDKASMEVPSPKSGKIKSIAVKLGDIIDTGDLVAVLEVMDADTPAAQELSDDLEQVKPAEIHSNPDQPSAPKTVRESTPVDGTGSRYEIRLPELGDVDDVEVIEVLVSVGDSVTADQPLVVLESDKATMEVPSLVAGIVENLAVAMGDKVIDNALIATVRSDDPQIVNLDVPVPSGETESSEPLTVPVPDETEHAKAKIIETRDAQDRSRSAVIYAGPAVRRLARELGVELALVVGSGVRGRVVKDDVKLYVKNFIRQPAAEPPSTGLPEVQYPDFTRYGEVEEVSLSRIQSRGAENLVRSWLNVVHVTQHDEADVTELEEFRVELNNQGQLGEQRLTALPFVLKACASTLREHPRFNASIKSNLKTLILKKYIHIGVAVDTPEGLVVPVIRDVLDKGLRDLASELENLSMAARDKSLTLDQISGASFTVSSLGRIGGLGFTPIVNAPEVAILGVARLATKPYWDGTKFEPRRFLPLSLSYDHRAINGAEGGRFMQSLVEKLDDVRRLIL